MYSQMFATEAEADAFVEGVEQAMTILDDDHLTTNVYQNGDNWIVELEGIV